MAAHPVVRETRTEATIADLKILVSILAFCILEAAREVILFHDVWFLLWAEPGFEDQDSQHRYKTQ